MSEAWHALTADEVLKRLMTRREGLTDEEVRERLERYGPNELPTKKKSPLMMLLRQFTNFLIVILLAATAVSALLGEVIDAAVIAIIVVIMGVAGFAQEFKAEKALEAIKALASPRARVIRGGKVVEVEAREVVPGDILVLREGDRIAADARVIEAWNLEVDESPLTGESVPVSKDPDAVLDPDTPVAERKNMVFMGTHVVKGKGLAVVVATGASTELGKIAASLTEIKEERTLLERELDTLGKKIGVVILGISGIVFATSTLEGIPIIDSFLLAVSLAVAAVPEGLPAVATTVLAIGARRMAQRNVLVRSLSAIETLGACNVIASDKTGTITKGEMTVRRVWVGGSEYEVTGVGYEPRGEVRLIRGEGAPVERLAEYIIRHIAQDVQLVSEGGQWRVLGSPTEGAALVLAAKVLGLDAVRPDESIVKTIPFDRFRKRKTTVHRLDNGRYLVISSGAPEYVLALSNRVLVRESEVPLSESVRKEIMKYIESLASSGYRTYALAYKVMDSLPENDEAIEEGLVFMAVMGIIDPPREGVREAVEEVRKAGIKVIMITGDHRLTAAAIAKEIGLEVGEGSVLEGKELDRMSDDELYEVVDKVVVYARVTPEHKRRIVRALKRRGYVVAMTGDGVNDAPALKEADIGIAMGIRGTDVAKEAAQLIIQDDNFVTIVEAVRQGRIIYENLKKPINYLIPANIGEVATIFLSQAMLMPPALKPVQLLWINVTTDSLPALGLSVEPPEPDIMERPPRGREEKLLTNRKLGYMTLLGTLIGVVNIAIFRYLLPLGLTLARTAVFTAMAFSEFGRALAARSERISFLKLPWNHWLGAGLAASVALQLMAVYLPPLQAAFSTVALPAWVLVLALASALPVLVVDEVRKALRIEV